jgi:Kef-type K+ transport system membrane component KefB
MNVESYIERRTSIASYLIFSPIFFASIGLKVKVSKIDTNILIFTLVLLAVAIGSKVIGCGIGAKLCGNSYKEALQIGVGMISRGEVALIVAQKGNQCKLVNEVLFAPIVIVVIGTTVLAPIFLKLVMQDR